MESRRRGRSDPAFTWISQPMRARVDLIDKDALAAVVETAVQEGLDRGPGEKTAPAVGEEAEARFKVKPHAFGFKPGVDVDRLNQLADELEAEEVAGKLLR